MCLKYLDFCWVRGLLTLVGMALLSQCTWQKDVACTMEFRTVGLQVNNGPLDRHYTLRLATGDTLFHPSEPLLASYYTVLSDQAQTWLQGRVEDFRFEGWRNDSLVITANYRIGADVCHLFKESGPEQWPQ